MGSPTVVASPPTTAERPQSRKSGDAAALAFYRRVRLIDRLAHRLIAVSGIAIIVAVLGIGVFLVGEIFPLVRGVRAQPERAQAGGTDGLPIFVLADEHQEKVCVLGADPTLRVLSLTAAALPQLIPLPGLDGRRLTAAARILRQPHLALATDRGEVWLGAVELRTVFEGSSRTVQAAVTPDTVVEVAPGRRLSALAYRDLGGRSLLASIVEGTSVIVTRMTTHRPPIGPVQRTTDHRPLPLDGLGSPTAVAVDGEGTQVLVGTADGHVIRWRLSSEGSVEKLETIRAVAQGSVSAMAYLLGDRSLVVGGDDGSVATWSLVRDEAVADGRRLTRIHLFPSHGAEVTSISPSPRDKGFVTLCADGVERLHYMTSERTLAEFTSRARPTASEFAPKADGVLVADETGAIHHWRIENPHPEVSWQALFGPVWYEGYPHPDYIWQSTGGTDDFEPKLSLVPLVFGTLKGTCYALLFAVPLALFGALYCSQFLDKRLRSRIKSTIELMAALPSVVMGFVAGVVLAPLVQGRIVAVLSLPVVLPAIAIGGMALGVRCPWAAARTVVRRHEFWVLVAWIVVGIAVADQLGPMIERGLFGGDFQRWLVEATGMRYDQRNSLVVGWAMGFAVIPIIFTICEDAFSAVPPHLVGASLACGASLWQTAWRVVLPAAGSGVFSAIMVGFGRAVGETMIVLMATGNTPVMDWSIFNGFRALSANIAVEIPEAPYGGTLYRVLFVAALLLFAMTFAVNTVAELIRLRLRRQLQGV